MVLSVKRSGMENEKRRKEERRRIRRMEKDCGDREKEELLRRREKEGGGLNQAFGRGDHHPDGHQRSVCDGAGGTVQVSARLCDGKPDERRMMRLLRGMPGA